MKINKLLEIHENLATTIQEQIIDKDPKNFWEELELNYEFAWLTLHDLECLINDVQEKSNQTTWYIDCKESIIEDAINLTTALNNPEIN